MMTVISGVIAAAGAVRFPDREQEGRWAEQQPRAWDNHTVRVAVLIVNWNAGAYLASALSALARQSRPADRIVVVDNASSDGSREAVARLPGVELIALDENVGFAAGNNIAAASVADCDWLAFLNPDAFPQPEWLERLMQAVKEHPEIPMFASELRLAADPSRLDGAGDAYHVSGLPWRIAHGERAPTDQAPREVFSPCAAAALVRRDIFNEVQGFDPSFFCYVEDVDLAFRLRLLGYRCLYIPGAVVHHVGSGTTGRRSAFAIYHGHRNLVWVWVKNMPGWRVWLYAPQHVLLTLVSLVRFGVIRHGRTIVRAKIDALAGLRRALSARRRVQRTRTAPGREIIAAMSRGWLAPYQTHRERPR
jgi:GT2 family glycosyltransferase